MRSSISTYAMTTGWWLTACCVLLASMIGAPSVLAQAEPDTVGSLPGIEIETAVDKAEAHIGDLIMYELTIVYDSTYTLVPPPLGANLGSFDVKDYQPDVETRLDDGRIQSRTTFKLSTFTTGEYTIPPLPVVFELPDSTRKLLLAEPVPINVLSLLDDAAGDSLDIRPLKAQYAFPHDYTPYYVWGGLGFVLIVLVIGLLFWFRRRKDEGELEDLRPPWEKSFEKLAFLRQEDFVGREEYKEYYLALTEISREYLGWMFKVDVLEMTTTQFMKVFADIELPDGVYDELGEFFKHADQVKFARYVPLRERTETDFELAHNMVEQIRAEFERRQEEEVKIQTIDKAAEPEIEETV